MKTHRDEINNMSNEELTRFLMTYPFSRCQNCAYGYERDDDM